MAIRFRTESEIRADLEQRFPKLKGDQWHLKSLQATNYQCIAWAACRTDFKWWPPRGMPRDECIRQGVYWPEQAPDDERVISFTQTFALFGYTQCSDFTFEWGLQKVAIFAIPDDDSQEDTSLRLSVEDYRVQHMARQKFFGGGWISKLGLLEDIIHRNVRSVECEIYGEAVRVLKRTWRDAIKFGVLNSWKHVVIFWWQRSTSTKGWPRIEDDMEQAQ